MRWIAIVFVFLTTAAMPATAAETRDRTMKIDVVSLIDRDEQREGRAEFAAQHGRYTYWFAEEHSKIAFLKDPQRYEVQMGGACGRMGPLSGEGTPRLFAVHDHKLFFFASEQCRAAFMAAPEKFIDTDDPFLQTTDESRARGRALLGRAVDATGCLAAIDTVTTYREVMAHDEVSGGKNYRVTRTVTLAWPEKMRSETCWNDSCYTSIADRSQGWLVGSRGAEPMQPSQPGAMWRADGRHVLSILRARDAADLTCAATGEKRTIVVRGEGEIDVELVAVHRAGATTTLGIDRSGLVRLMEYRGRGPDLTLGRVQHTFSRFHVVGGLRLPGRVDVSFNGAPVPDQSGEYAEQVVDDPADRARVEPPALAMSSAPPPPATPARPTEALAAVPLVTEGIVDASVEDVWEAFTVKEEIEKWMVPLAEIDLRVGGKLRTSYNKDAELGDASTIEHTILAFEPRRMLALRVTKAPEGFQFADLIKDTWTVVYFESLGEDRTRLREVGMGYGAGGRWDEMRKFFEAGNAWTLERLRKLLGPDDQARAAATEADAEVLRLLHKLVGGHWIVENTRPDGSIFRVRTETSVGPDGQSLLSRGCLGDAGGMYDHGLTVMYRRPRDKAAFESTGADGVTSAKTPPAKSAEAGGNEVWFHNVNEGGALTRGRITLAQPRQLIWDWTATALNGEIGRFRVEMTFENDDRYRFRLSAQAKPGGEFAERVNVVFNRVQELPEAFTKMKAGK